MPSASSRTASSSRSLPREPLPASGRTTIRRPTRSPAPLISVATATGRPAATSRGDVAELRKAVPADRLDEDVDDAAAGQPDRERVVVADAVALQDAAPVRSRGLGQLVHRALDAAAGHAAHRAAVRADRHRRAGLAGGRAPGADHRGRRPTVSPAAPPVLDVGHHVTHRRSPPPARAAPSKLWPATQLVEVRQRRHHTRGEWGEPVLALVRVDPDDRVRQPATAEPSARRAGQRRPAPSRRRPARPPPAGPSRAAPTSRGRPAAPRRAGYRPASRGSPSPAACSAASGSRSRSCAVTRVSRVPIVNTSVLDGRDSHRRVGVAQQHVRVRGHRAADVQQQDESARSPAPTAAPRAGPARRRRAASGALSGRRRSAPGRLGAGARPGGSPCAAPACAIIRCTSARSSAREGGDVAVSQGLGRRSPRSAAARRRSPLASPASAASGRCDTLGAAGGRRPGHGQRWTVRPEPGREQRVVDAACRPVRSTASAGPPNRPRPASSRSTCAERLDARGEAGSVRGHAGSAQRPGEAGERATGSGSEPVTSAGCETFEEARQDVAAHPQLVLLVLDRSAQRGLGGLGGQRRARRAGAQRAGPVDATPRRRAA